MKDVIKQARRAQSRPQPRNWGRRAPRLLVYYICHLFKFRGGSMQEKNKQLLMDGWQLRLIWWWSRVDWRGAGCPRHPSSLNLQTQHLKTSRNLLPGGPPPHYLKICSVIQNVCSTSQPPAFLPASPHSTLAICFLRFYRMQSLDPDF